MRMFRRKSIVETVPQLAYGGVGIVVLLLYFGTYRSPAHHPVGATLWQPMSMAAYFCVWVGAPLGHVGQMIHTSGVVGVALLLLFSVSVAYMCVRHRSAALSSAVYSWIILGGFVLLTGAAITFGRSAFGLQQALASRYHSFSLLFVPVVFVLLLICMNLVSTNWPTVRVIYACSAIAFLAGGGAVLFVLGCLSGWTEAKAYGELRRQAQLAISFIDVIPDNPQLTLAHPDPSGIVRIFQRLRPLGLPGIRVAADRISSSLMNVPNAAGDGSNGFLDRVGYVDRDHLFVGGWAVLKNSKRPADAVLVAWTGRNGTVKPISVVPINGDRQDVAAALTNNAYRRSGFSASISTANVPGPGRISGWAIDMEASKIYPLAGGAAIP
jgi:hypothetical protein